MVCAMLVTTTWGAGMMEGTAAYHKLRPGTVLTHAGSGSSFTEGGTVSIDQSEGSAQIYGIRGIDTDFILLGLGVVW